MYYSCPHCGGLFEIEAKNCGIFRHAVWKSNMQSIPPHASLQEIEEWLQKERIFGCGRPFRFHRGLVEICDYI